MCVIIKNDAIKFDVPHNGKRFASKTLEKCECFTSDENKFLAVKQRTGFIFQDAVETKNFQSLRHLNYPFRWVQASSRARMNESETGNHQKCYRFSHAKLSELWFWLKSLEKHAMPSNFGSVPIVDIIPKNQWNHNGKHYCNSKWHTNQFTREVRANLVLTLQQKCFICLNLSGWWVIWHTDIV